MSIKSALKREGIEVIDSLDSLTISSIASTLAKVLQKTFPEKNLNTHQIFSDILKLNMYIAKLPTGCSAKYFYKNKSIYFSPDTSFDKISDLMVHECIHYLQERVNKRGDLVRLGFCDFKHQDLPGMGLNEASVQLLSSTCVRSKTETVTYFDLTFNTTSPDYYPLECALANQLSYLIGHNVLFDSTLNSNDNFKNQFISFTSKETFETIQKNFDLLIELQESIAKLTSYNIHHEQNTNKIHKNNLKIDYIKSKIKTLFLDTQNIILTSYFDNTINLLYTKEAFEKYRNKLYNFRNYIATTDGYTFFNRYYINKMAELENRYETRLIPDNNSIILYKESPIQKVINHLKYLFKLTSKNVYIPYYEQEFYD